MDNACFTLASVNFRIDYWLYETVCYHYLFVTNNDCFLQSL